MTPDQCRAARERLNWTRDELRKAADVPLWFVAAFEGDAGLSRLLGSGDGGCALGDAGADEPPTELGRNLPFDSEEQVNAYVMAQLKALSQ
jgi:hypothetical protein